MIYTATVAEPGREEDVLAVCIDAICTDRNRLDVEGLRTAAERGDAEGFMEQHMANDPDLIAAVQYGPYQDREGIIHARMAYIVVAVEGSIKEGEGVDAPWEKGADADASL